MFRESFIVKCPQGCGDDIRSLSRIPQDMPTLLILIKNNLQCDEHNQTAIGYNLLHCKLICSECKIPSSITNDTMPPVIAGKLFIEYCMHKKTLSKEIRELVRLNCNDRLQVTVELIRMIVQYCNTRMFCVNHPDIQATFIDYHNLDFQCDNCKKENYMKIDHADSLPPIREYCQIFLAYDKLICSTVARFLESPSMESISKPYIGLIQIWKGKFGKLEQVGCQSCGKLYHLGLQMPVKLSCEHFICYQCSKTKRNCNICRSVCDRRADICIPIESLYQVPQCCICWNQVTLDITGETANNLPYHNFCNCIFCANCNEYNCDECNADHFMKKNYYHKLHRRSVKALMYLKVSQQCGQCKSNPGSFWDKTSFMVICSTCFTYHDRIPITDLFRLESYLMTYNRQPQMLQMVPPELFEYYPSLPIQLKMKILTSTHSSTPVDRTYPYGEVHQLRRFSCVYPVTTDDHRVFKINVEYINLTCVTDHNIKVIGVILAGRKNLKAIRQDIAYTWNREVCEKSVDVRCKENIIFLDDMPASNFLALL